MNVLIAPGMLPAHVLPYVEPARLLRRRGARVYFYGETYAARHAAPTGATFLESAAPNATEVLLRQRGRAGQIAAAARYTEAVALDLRRRIARLRPDVALVDQMNPGAALALTACGVPWASLAISPAILNPGIDDWPTRMVPAKLRAALGLPPTEQNSLQQGISPHLFLLPWAPGLDLWGQPPRSEHVGNVYAASTPAPELRAWLGKRGRVPRILVSLSTAPGPDQQAVLSAFVGRLLEALSRLDVRAIVTLGNIGHVKMPTAPSPQVRIERFVDHSAIMDRIDVGVNQGGWGTISRTLARGVPMLVVPFERDQFGNAGLCQATGIGIVSLAPALSTAAIASAIAYLGTRDNPFALRAQEHARVLRRAGGPARVTRLLTRLARA